MGATEITYGPADGLPPDWAGAEAKLDRITLEDVSDSERDYQSLLDYNALSAAGEERDAAFLAQVREVLAEDLRAMEKISADPASAGEVADDDATVPAFEPSGENFIARGPRDPRSTSDWLTPYWRVVRLMDSGALAFVGYKLVGSIKLD